MLTNQLKKKVKSLHQLKFRQKYDKFIAEGPKICDEYLSHTKYKLDHIFCNENWFHDNQALIAQYSGKTTICKDKELDSITCLKNSNKILIVLDRETSATSDLGDKLEGWAIYLDDIRDPGNLGTIIRIADWYGINHVFCSPECVDIYNPKVIQSAMGSHNRVDVLSSPFEEVNDRFSASYGLVIDGQNIGDLSSPAKGLIVIGNEARGIRIEIKEKLTSLVRIPGEGGAESLNASVACGIACHQLLY